MLSSSSLAKLCVAVTLIVQVSAFSAVPSLERAMPSLSPSAVSTTEYRRDVSCYATNKKENCPGKTAFNGSNNVGGIGGLGINKANKKIARPAATNKSKKVVKAAPKKSVAKAAPKKAVPKKTVAKASPKKQAVAKSTGGSPPADIDWGPILLAFLIPWRNPNSIFLYLLIIVSVLGKLNENPQ